ncbi:MAG: hypothetical protein ACRDRL_25675 [Sciscionella sp.]
MNPTISAALAADRRDHLLREAELIRRAQLARRRPVLRRAPARRAASTPFVAFRGWLARGYL